VFIIAIMKQKLPFLSSFFAFWLCFGCMTPLAGGALSTHELKTLLTSIEPHAMHYGEGPLDVYVFLDPKCPHSRDFMGMLYDNDKMRSIYRYHIFCYELPRFKSHNLIGAIYTSPTPLQSLLEVMVAKKEPILLKSIAHPIDQQIQAIETVALTIGIKKRPYLIIAKDWN